MGAIADSVCIRRTCQKHPKLLHRQENAVMQVGKKTEGDMIDPEPERKEGFAIATFDLEDIRWQRAR